MNKLQNLTPTEKEAYFIELTTALFKGELTEGELLKKLRSDYLGINQDAYAKLVGISRRSLHEVESNRRALNLGTLNKVFAPLGYKVGLVPLSTRVMTSAAKNMDENAD